MSSHTTSAAIIVVGSADQDSIVRVAAPPAPGETVLAKGLLQQPGGKGANQAVAAARLDTTGAGDAFVGALAACLAHGCGLERAVQVGVLAGSYAVRSPGAQSSGAVVADLGLDSLAALPAPWPLTPDP